MRQFVLALACVAVALAGSATAYSKTYHGDKVYRVTPINAEQLGLLVDKVPFKAHKGALDFWNLPSAVGRSVDIHVAKSNIREFEAFLALNSFHHSILVDNLQRQITMIDALNMRLKGQKQLGDIVGTFASFDDINQWLSDQCTAYPNITVCGSMGQSYEGRDMRWIRIGKKSTGPVSPRKAIYIVSGMHAREWLGPATIIWIMNQMLTQYNKDPTITSLINTYDWYIDPVVNPDGYEYSRNNDRMWRKTTTPTSNDQCPGIDGNRNFDYKWNGDGDPCDETYPGESALEDKVTTNINNFMLKQNKTQHGLAFFSIHTYSSVWMLPYGYAEKTYPADYNELLRVGTEGVNALMAVHQTSWQVGNIVDLLYVATGNSADYFKGHNLVKYSFAMELRGNSFVVPASQIVPSGQEVMAGFWAAANAMKA